MKKLPEISELQRIFTLGDDGVLRWNWRADLPFNVNRRLAGKPAGATDSSGYIHVGIKGKLYQAHRIVWALVNGEDPHPHLLDHVNGNRKDNRADNLRAVTAAVNVVNGRARGRLNLKGVYEFRPGVFVAQTKHNGATKYLGRYASAAEAHEVYCLATDMLHGAGAYAR